MPAAVFFQTVRFAILVSPPLSLKPLATWWKDMTSIASTLKMASFKIRMTEEDFSTDTWNYFFYYFHYYCQHFLTLVILPFDCEFLFIDLL